MFRLFSFLIFLMLLVSCTKDKETGNVDLVFFLQYKGQPLVMYDTFNYPVTNQKLIFTKFACYLSDLTLHNKNNTDNNVLEIDWLDMTNAHDASNAANGFTYTIKDLNTGDYQNISFGIGVPQKLNALAPKDYASDHVLSSTTNYWSSWKSYIFSRTEGRIDFDGDGNLEDTFTLHAGGDDAYTPISLAKNFTIKKDETTRIEIVIDMEKYFNGSSMYDIMTYPSIHSLEHIPAIIILRENLKTAISLK